jgi:predicted alpha/beta-fold hydrolase
VHGFESASDYYTRSNSRHFLAGITRPTLLLSALDDPFLPREVSHDVALMASDNDCLTVEFHERGGHVGFVSGRVPWRPVYHAEERAIEYLAARLATSSFLSPGLRT